MYSTARDGTGDRPEIGAEEAADLLIQLMPKLLRTAIAAMHEAPHTAGMTLAQFKILSRLNERDHRAGELAEALEVGGATLTVTADTLERRGLIERVRGLPDDRSEPRGRPVRAVDGSWTQWGRRALSAPSTPPARAASPAASAAPRRGSFPGGGGSPRS